MTLESPLVLVAGAASRDIVSDDPRGWRLGGAVTYGSLAVARLGLRVRAMIGVDEAASRAIELDHLRAAGVELHLVRLASGPVFENLEAPGGRRQRCLAPSDPVRVTSLPTRWAEDLDGLLLAPVADELGEAWASVYAPVVALGWQGIVRELRADEFVARRGPTRSRLLAAASLVGASRGDFAPATSAASLARLLSPGATLALTDGDAGGQLVLIGADGRPGRVRRYPVIPSDRAVDPTGAGDAFLAALLAARLQPRLGNATRFAAAAASLTVEAPGLAGIPDLAAVRARMTRTPSRASRRPRAISSLGRGRPSQA